MAFSGFPSAQNNNSPFGGFGTPAATTTGFSGFGAPATAAPAFGAQTGSTFGTNVGTTSAFGTNTGTGLFGSTQPAFGQAAPAFGAAATPAFGTSTANTTPFGAITSTTSAFGTAAPNAFGTPTAGTAFGGTGTFGAPTSSAFGVPTSSAGFGGFASTFGAPTSSTGTSLFGNTTQTSGGGLFNTAPTAAAGTSFGAFGGGTMFGNTSTPSTGFGSFGTKLATTQSNAFGGFSSTFSNLGQPQQQSSLFGQQVNPMQQQQLQPQEDPVVTAVMNVNCTGDERDAILSRWNLIQAQWGTGKGYYNNNAQPVTFTQQNIFCRFKALGYNLLPTGKDEEGIVSITISKKETEVRSQQQQIHSALQNLVSSRQMTVAIQEIRGSTNDTTQILITVSERTATGQSKKILASDLANFLNSIKAQLASIAVSHIAAVVAPSPEEIQSYLSSPPIGIEPRLWHQAQQDNPDPKRYVPVPMVGFGELRSRMTCQEAESSRHVAFLSQAKDKLEEMQRHAAESKAKLEQRTLSLRSLQRRLMTVLVKLQVLRREGTALLSVEEELRARLEHIKNVVSQPSHCKVRLGELMSQTELKSFMGRHSDYLGKYQLDPDSLQELQKYLKMEQEGISHLIDVATTDTDHIRFMQQDMIQVRQSVINSSNTALLNRQAQLASSFLQNK